MLVKNVNYNVHKREHHYIAGEAADKFLALVLVSHNCLKVVENLSVHCRIFVMQGSCQTAPRVKLMLPLLI